MKKGTLPKIQCVECGSGFHIGQIGVLITKGRFTEDGVFRSVCEHPDAEHATCSLQCGMKYLAKQTGDD